VAAYGATLNRRSYGAEPFFLSPRCAEPVACDSVKKSRKDMIISARSFVTFVFSRLFLLDIIHLIPPWIGGTQHFVANLLFVSVARVEVVYKTN
jgi:hypothetical protein